MATGGASRRVRGELEWDLSRPSEELPSHLSQSCPRSRPHSLTPPPAASPSDSPATLFSFFFVSSAVPCPSSSPLSFPPWTSVLAVGPTGDTPWLGLRSRRPPPSSAEPGALDVDGRRQMPDRPSPPPPPPPFAVAAAAAAAAPVPLARPPTLVRTSPHRRHYARRPADVSGKSCSVKTCYLLAAAHHRHPLARPAAPHRDCLLRLPVTAADRQQRSLLPLDQRPARHG